MEIFKEEIQGKELILFLDDSALDKTQWEKDLEIESEGTLDVDEFFTRYFYKCFKNYLFQGVYAEYIETFARKYGLSKIGILAYSDIDTDDGCWLFRDGGEKRNVQEWIDELDGRFACLCILSCNPGPRKLSSKKSLVLIPDRNCHGNIRAMLNAGTIFTLLHPKKGEIDDYTIDYELDILKNSKRKTRRGSA